MGEALTLEPAEIDARLMLAALLGATGRTKEAKAAFHEALERAEDPIEIAEMFLKWLVARGDKAEAAAEADRLVPDVIDEGTVEMVVRVERAAGRVDRVRAAADQAIKKGASTARMALLVSGALVDSKDFAGAAALLLKVPKDAPEFVESRLRAAEALRAGASAADLERASHALDDAAAQMETSASRDAAPAPVGTTRRPSAPGTHEVEGGRGTSTPHDFTTELAVARALLDEKRGDAVRAARFVGRGIAEGSGQPPPAVGAGGDR